MSKILVNNIDELEEYINEHKIRILGSGQEGICYEMDSGIVLKKLFTAYNPKYALQFVDIDNPSFVFCKEAIVIDDYAHALLMELVQGETIRNKMPFDQSIDLLAVQLQELVNDIIKISEQGVLVKDFHCGNIIYDNERFRVIDTSSYLRLNKTNNKKENINEIMLRIYSNLLYQILNYKEIPDSFIYLGRTKLFEIPYEYFLELKKYIENITEEQIITLNDAKKVLSKRFGKK